MSTKSDRSPGSQFVKKGVTQGVMLVDSTTGMPVSASNPLPVVGSSSGSPDVNIHDSAGNNLTSTVGALDVNIKTQGAGLAQDSSVTAGNASLTSIDGKLNSLGQKTSAASAPVVLASDQSAIPVVLSGSLTTSRVDLFRNDYSVNNATTSAYLQVLTATSADAKRIEIFDSSGQTLLLAFGASGSEVNQIYITPGGNGQVQLDIPSGTRLSVKAVSANASTGELTVNTYNG